MAEKRAFTLFLWVFSACTAKANFWTWLWQTFQNTQFAQKIRIKFHMNDVYIEMSKKKYSLTKKKKSNKKIAEIFKSSKNQRKFAKIETEKEIECIDVKSVESEINLNGSYNCCYWTFFLIQCLVSRYLSAALLLDKKWQSTSKNRTKTKLNGMEYQTEVDVNQPRMGKESVSQITVSLCLTARLWKFTWKIASH